MTTIKDREGKRFVNEDEVLERWREHFEGVLNEPRPDIPLPEIDQAPEVITSIETADRNGKHQCTLTLLTFQRHLTALTESDFGTS